MCKNFEKNRSIYLPSNNIEIFMGSDTDKIIDDFLKSLLQRFQYAKEKSNERGSEFIHENVLLCYILHEKAVHT